MPSSIYGILKTSDASTNELANEWQETVLVRNAKGFNTGSTLFGLMAKLEKEPADNIEYNWFERAPVRRDFYAAAAVASTSTTTVTFDDNASSPDTTVWKLLNDGAVLKNNNTGEVVIVNGDPTSSSVTIIRGALGSTAVNIGDNDLFTLITIGRPEGATAARAKYENPSTYTNYIQTFNATVELSNAFKNSVLRTDVDGPLKERRIQALENIANDIEFAFLFGDKGTATVSSNTVYYTGGVRNAIVNAGLSSTNILNGQTTTGVSLASLQSWLQSFMVNGSDAKLAFCGPNAYAAISNYANTAAGGFRVMNQETVFGMNITEILTPFGVLNLAFHPLLKNSTAHNGSVVVVDLGLICQKTFEPLFLETNIQTPGQNSYKEQYRAQLGLKLKFPGAFGYAYDLQKITAS